MIDMRRLSAIIGAIISVWALLHQELALAETQDQEPSDWPTVIAQLQQQMYQRPGVAHIREQLATACNNYGVQLGEQRRWEQAIEQLERARTLEPSNEQFKTNLSAVYLNQAGNAYAAHQPQAAIDLIEKTLQVKPTARAYDLLGQIEYDRQRLKEAKAAWQQAAELDPSLPGLAQHLARVTEELPIESKFGRMSQAYFDLRSEEHLNMPADFDLRDALLEARREVGKDFAYWPKHKIVVLLYSAESFHKLRQDTPEWVGGQFDGKIRVPLPSAQMSSALVKQILFHEYTHAVIADLTEGKCPRWLNEGLAEHEGRTQLAKTSTFLKTAYNAQQLIPLAELSDHFSSMRSANEAALAYDQSYSLVAHLLEHAGFWRMRQLLKALAEGRPWENALESAYHLETKKLEKNWRGWLPGFLSS